MGNLVRVGTLTYATWQADAPHNGQHGTIRPLAMDNLAMALRDGQLTTQWHHAMGIIEKILYHTMVNLAHNGTHGTSNLSRNGTTHWATYLDMGNLACDGTSRWETLHMIGTRVIGNQHKHTMDNFGHE